jgi:hypothetical protein
MRHATIYPIEVHRQLLAVDKLHRACVYLAGQFSNSMTRDEAQANFNARTIFANIQNHILDCAYGLEGVTPKLDSRKVRLVSGEVS